MAHKPKLHSCPGCGTELHIKTLPDPTNPKRTTRTLVRKLEPLPTAADDPMRLHFEMMAKQPPVEVVKEAVAPAGPVLKGDADMMEHHASMSMQ